MELNTKLQTIWKIEIGFQRDFEAVVILSEHVPTVGQGREKVRCSRTGT